MGTEDKEGRAAAKTILRTLGFTRFMDTDPQKSLPIDLAASNGKERYLIELKYAERPNVSTSGFPFQWIRRATSVIKDERVARRGYKLLVMVISKNEGGTSYLLLKPCPEFWSICKSHGTEKSLEKLKDELYKWDE